MLKMLVLGKILLELLIPEILVPQILVSELFVLETVLRIVLPAILILEMFQLLPAMIITENIHDKNVYCARDVGINSIPVTDVYIRVACSWNISAKIA